MKVERIFETHRIKQDGISWIRFEVTIIKSFLFFFKRRIILDILFRIHGDKSDVFDYNNNLKKYAFLEKSLYHAYITHPNY